MCMLINLLSKTFSLEQVYCAKQWHLQSNNLYCAHIPIFANSDLYFYHSLHEIVTISYLLINLRSVISFIIYKYQHCIPRRPLAFEQTCLHLILFLATCFQFSIPNSLKLFSDNLIEVVLCSPLFLFPIFPLYNTCFAPLSKGNRNT